MVIAGPRVIQSIASDYPIIGILGKRDSEKVPRLSMLIQALIAIAITLTGSFDTVITYTTFTMTLFSTLTVLGTIVLRKTKPNLSRPYRTFGYPLTPIIFILANCWFMYYLFLNNMDEALIGLVIILSGLILFFLVPKKKVEYTSQTEAIKDLS
jgi:APA family basic amino acid/polyamine antiporter